jgi:uncharacterized protein YecT (DUF1311 family)
MFFTPPAARAEDVCDGINQWEMNMCAANKFEKADKAMNERYGKLMKRLDPEDQVKLRQAQRAWIAYRDKWCEFETNGLGSVRPMIFAGCLTGLTEDHSKNLDYQLTCEEGDLSCKGWVGHQN